MRHPERPSPLLLLRFFHGSTCLLVVVGFSMIAITDQISHLACWLFLAGYITSLVPRVNLRLQLTPRQSNWATRLYALFFAADIFLMSRSFVPATLHLVLFVLVVKLYQPKTNRDYFQIILLSFLLVVAASSLTISLYFLVLLTLFLLVSTATLISFEMLRHLGGHLPHAMQERSRSEGEPITALVVVPGEVLQRRVLLHISLVSALCLVFILSFGGILFFAIPRIGVGFFQRSAGQKLVLSGFSDHVRLGAIGAIQLDNAVVMRVKIDGNPTAYHNVKWRGVAVDYFDGRAWSKGVRGPILEFTTGKEFRLRTSPVRGPRVYYQVLLEPASSNYLFSMDRVLWVGGNLCPLRHDPFR